jgi:hypothetical protein
MLVEEREADWLIQKQNELCYELMLLHEIAKALKIPCACSVCRKI